MSICELYHRGLGLAAAWTQRVYCLVTAAPAPHSPPSISGLFVLMLCDTAHCFVHLWLRVNGQRVYEGDRGREKNGGEGDENQKKNRGEKRGGGRGGER